MTNAGTGGEAATGEGAKVWSLPLPDKLRLLGHLAALDAHFRSSMPWSGNY
jgi:hypothetical protein